MAFEIGRYLQNIDDACLTKRLMSDYKDGKGYIYFASGWLKEVFYHPLSDSSNLCLLKASCRPSQNLNIPWEMWICIAKKTGDIHSAFCTCFAG